MTTKNEENWFVKYIALREHVVVHGHLTDRPPKLNHWWKYKKKRNEGKLAEEQERLFDELMVLRKHEHTCGCKKKSLTLIISCEDSDPWRIKKSRSFAELVVVFLIIGSIPVTVRNLDHSEIEFLIMDFTFAATIFTQNRQLQASSLAKTVVTHIKYL